MKKFILSLILMGFGAGLTAQVPNGFNYQAALRNSGGQPIANSNVKLRFTIHNSAANGTVLYQETQTLTTSTQGLVNCVVGKGTVVTGAYPNAVQWANDLKFLQVELDPAGGNSFTDLGTTQLVAVPFAHYATTADIADSTSGNIHPSQILSAGAATGQVLKWNGTAWIPDVDASGGAGGGDNWGTQTVITNSTLSGAGTSGNTLKIAQQGAVNGNVLKWNGSSWLPANDSSGGTYTGGNGITLSGSTINSTWTTAVNDISNNNSGNVGIGATNPAAKLDVNGDTKIGGNLGVLGTNPDANFFIKSSGASNREMLIEATGTANYSGIQLRSSAGANDFLTLKKYGATAGGTYTDGTAFARSASIIAGSSSNRMVLGTLSATSDLHLITGSRTRLQIDKDGNLYSGAGLSTGAKLHLTKGTNGFTGPTGGLYAPSLFISQDTTIKGYYSAGITAYAASGKVGAIGGYFSAGRKGKDTMFNYGIYGETSYEVSNDVSYGYGSNGFSTGSRYNFGVSGSALSSRASSLTYGVYGYASGESKSSTTAYAIYGYAEKAGANYAGYFAGTTHVNGTFTATTKTFLIDHPLDPANKYLQFTCIESPDMLNIYNGNIVTDVNGFATVVLPDYFEAANIDFKYQLTVIGQFAQAIIKERIADNKFVIQTDKPNVDVSWQVTGVRNDEYAKQNRIVPEYEKAAEHKGKFLHPELYNLPMEDGIHFQQPPLKINSIKVQPNN